MPVINISVENKIAEADGTLYVCGNSDFVAKFAFDAEWEAYENKTARFCYNNSYVDVVFTGNECPVPIISGTYFFNIGVYAGNLHTTTPARVPCKKSILCGNESESSASQEVKNEFLDVLDKRTGDLDKLQTTAKDNLVAAINEAARTGGGESDHSKLINRDAQDQHPIGAIAGLADALAGKQPKGDYLTADKLQSATDAALAQAKASGVFDGAPGAKGDPGEKGDPGAKGDPGSDASVTKQNITNALGYTPANADNVPSFSNKNVLDAITGIVTPEKLAKPDHKTDLVQYDAFQAAAQQIIGQIPTVPEALKNPEALTIKLGGATTTYDGSSAQEVNLPEIVVAESVTSPAYTNQIPLSVDAGGAIYNGVGYKSGVLLNASGAETSGSGVAVSGYIPVKKGDIIRIKDTSRADVDTTLILTLTAAKAGTANCGKTISSIQGNALYGTITINGNVATWDTSGIGYYFWNDFAWLRVTTHSADAIVTVNEEIADTVTTQNVLKSNVKVKKANVDFDIASPLLSGKTVVCFGDSIFGMTRDTTSVPAWAAAFSGAKVYNVGFGGCRMAVHPTIGYAAFSMWALADAVSSGSYTTQDAQAASGADYFAQQLAVLKSIDFANVGMAVIHYGTNDFTGNVAIDNADDDDDTSTLCGALRYALRKIQTAYPKIRVFVSLPIYRKWDSTGAETYTNANGKKLREFCTALAGVADEFNCPCIDGYKALGINAANASAFLADGTHLNEYGRQAFGEYIGGCLISPKT